jgi:hypothetical protein
MMRNIGPGEFHLFLPIHSIALLHSQGSKERIGESDAEASRAPADRFGLGVDGFWSRTDCWGSSRARLVARMI